MNPFTFVTREPGRRPAALPASPARVRFIAGGTNLIDLMKEA
jgi:CO/xanthine dehydrogenase FAD-binding subunit